MTKGHTAERGGPADDLRAVLERLDLGVVVRRMEVGFARLPAYTRFLWKVDRGAVMRWNVDLALRWVINGMPPDGYVRSELYELLRARAAAGQRIEDGILVYRRGARLFREAVLDLSDDEGRAVLTAQADTVWECLEEYLDLIVGVLAQAHGDHQDSPAMAGAGRGRFSTASAHSCRSRSRTGTGRPGSVSTSRRGPVLSWRDSWTRRWPPMPSSRPGCATRGRSRSPSGCRWPV